MNTRIWPRYDGSVNDSGYLHDISVGAEVTLDTAALPNEGGREDHFPRDIGLGTERFTIEDWSILDESQLLGFQG